MIPWTPSGGLGARSTLVVGGLGADGRGFVHGAPGCVGELRGAWRAATVAAFAAPEPRRALRAEASGPHSAAVQKPLRAEVDRGA